MARIVCFREYGGPEVLKIEELPLQQPGDGEVHCRLRPLV
jgi:NADPH:quinone reductase-like Zn-dependent oxidoreductase